MFLPKKATELSKYQTTVVVILFNIFLVSVLISTDLEGLWTDIRRRKTIIIFLPRTYVPRFQKLQKDPLAGATTDPGDYYIYIIIFIPLVV